MTARPDSGANLHVPAIGWRLETLEILDGDLRDHRVNDSQEEDLASSDKVGRYAER